MGDGEEERGMGCKQEGGSGGRCRYASKSVKCMEFVHLMYVFKSEAILRKKLK